MATATQQVLVRVPVEVYASLQASARASGESLNAWVVQAIRERLGMVPFANVAESQRLERLESSVPVVQRPASPVMERYPSVAPASDDPNPVTNGTLDDFLPGSQERFALMPGGRDNPRRPKHSVITIPDFEWPEEDQSPESAESGASGASGPKSQQDERPAPPESTRPSAREASRKSPSARRGGTDSESPASSVPESEPVKRPAPGLESSVQSPGTSAPASRVQRPTSRVPAPRMIGNTATQVKGFLNTFGERTDPRVEPYCREHDLPMLQRYDGPCPGCGQEVSEWMCVRSPSCGLYQMDQRPVQFARKKEAANPAPEQGN